MARISESRAAHRGPRFGVLTLLVLITAIAVALGLFTREWHRAYQWHWAYQRRQVDEEVRRLGGYVRLGAPEEPAGVVAGWLHVFLGDEYFTEVVEVSWTPPCEEDLNLLRAFPELRSLRLEGPVITDAAIRRLASLHQLRELSLSDAVISNKGLESLMQPPNLRVLSFTNCSLTDDSLKALYGARSLVELRLNESGVSEAGILAMRDANPALAISFDRQPGFRGDRLIKENYLPSVFELPQVKELTFKGPCVSDATLAVLQHAHSLTTLRLEWCRITDDGLENLRELSQLTHLTLLGTNLLSDTTLSNLRRQNPELSNLARSDCQITDRGLEHIGHLNALTSLVVSGCHITDDGMQHLQSLPNLTLLWVSGQGISDEGLRNLQGLTSLRSLDLADTNVSDSGITELQQALPTCKITR